VGFTALPRRWVVERFLAWLNHNHRLPMTWSEPSRLPPLSCSPLARCCSPDASLFPHEIRVGLFQVSLFSGPEQPSQNGCNPRDQELQPTVKTADERPFNDG
jgi:hypothetical protein